MLPRLASRSLSLSVTASSLRQPFQECRWELVAGRLACRQRRLQASEEVARTFLKARPSEVVQTLVSARLALDLALQAVARAPAAETQVPRRRLVQRASSPLC